MASEITYFVKGLQALSPLLKEFAERASRSFPHLKLIQPGETLYRGVQKGTEDLAFTNPRELGAHMGPSELMAKSFAQQSAKFDRAGTGAPGRVLEYEFRGNTPLVLEDSATWEPEFVAGKLANELFPGATKGSVERASPLGHGTAKAFGKLERKFADSYSDLSRREDEEFWDSDLFAVMRDRMYNTQSKALQRMIGTLGADHVQYPNTWDVSRMWTPEWEKRMAEFMRYATERPSVIVWNPDTVHFRNAYDLPVNPKVKPKSIK